MDHIFVTFFSVVIFFWISDTQANPIQSRCRDGYNVDCGERCYQFIYRSVTWDTAKWQCERRGGRLASVRSSDEQKCLANVHRRKYSAGDHGDAAQWIGLHVDASENTSVTDLSNWKWVDPDLSYGPESFSNWAVVGNESEPNDLTKRNKLADPAYFYLYDNEPERCASVVFADEYRIVPGGPSVRSWGLWNNDNCLKKKHYICEAPKIVITTTTTTTTTASTKRTVLPVFEEAFRRMESNLSDNDRPGTREYVRSLKDTIFPGFKFFSSLFSG